MKFDIWLQIGAKKSGIHWHPNGVKALRSKPAPKSGAINVKVEMEIPDAVFDEPIFTVKCKMPEPRRDFPGGTEVAQAVEKAMSDHMGFRVKVDIAPPSEVQA